MPHCFKPLAAALLALAASVYSLAAQAQSVALTGTFGNKALLVINGSTPRALAPGSTVDGVKLIGVNGDQAVIEVNGRRQTLVLGDSPVSLGSGAGAAGGGSQIVLTAGTGGHFVAQGQINGRAVQFMVDTGATSVALSQAEADRIGLKYKDGQRIGINTANGSVPAHRVTLNSVRLGDVEVHNVDAVVSPEGMPFVLLGNSFLSRFQMKRENDRLTLDRRF